MTSYLQDVSREFDQNQQTDDEQVIRFQGSVVIQPTCPFFFLYFELQRCVYGLPFLGGFG